MNPANVELYIDGNRGWTASEAVRALRGMDDLGLTFAEELCPADDVLGRRWLVEHSSVPVFADESVARSGEVTRELLGGAANGISIKTARTGFTASQRVLHLCEGLGVEVVIGNQIDGQIGSLCSVAFGAAFELTSRRAGELQYSNLSIFDVEDNGELHDLLWGLPLFEYMTVTVTPLAAHPSDIGVLAGR